MDGRTINGKVQSTAGGVGRNVADCMARLGANPFFISNVGAQEYAETLLSKMDHMKRVRRRFYVSLLERHKLTPHLLQEIVEYALHLGYLHRSDPPTVGQCSAPSGLISFGGGGAGEAFF